MPFNTTAAVQLFETRKHLPDNAVACQLCRHVFTITDDCLHWLIAKADEYPFVKKDILEEILELDRLQREPHVPRFYQALGIHHAITLDSNSKGGSIVVDFNTNIENDTGFNQTFDLVDNCGVTEHIFDQRAVFENIHRLCKTGGVMLHRSPMFGVLNIMLIGVTPLYWHDIAIANGYEILDLRVANRWGDTVRALLPGDNGADRDYRAAIPSVPGEVSEGGAAALWAYPTIAPEQLPEEMLLPPSMTLDEMTRKTPLPVMSHPLARVCRTLEERAKAFRPEVPGEIYATAIFRKIHDEPFCVPYQSNSIMEIEPVEFRARYRRQFEAQGLSITP
ncbi:MAG: hypothetical protein RL693_12 [Verrucomicrobiota bacterium]|jgi:SAM-dependent methyltransferase